MTPCCPRALPALGLAAVLALAGCGSDDGPAPTPTPAAGPPVLAVGALAGPDGGLLGWARGQTTDVDLQWLQATDAETLHQGVADGTMQAALVGTAGQAAARGDAGLADVGAVMTLADAFYGTPLDQLGDTATVLLPDDPGAAAEGLRALADAGVIGLDGDGTDLDQVRDDSDLQIVQVGPTELVQRAGEEDTAAFVPAELAGAAGLTAPVLLELPADRETRVLVSTTDGATSDDVTALYGLLTSDGAREYLTRTYGDVVSFG